MFRAPLCFALSLSLLATTTLAQEVNCTAPATGAANPPAISGDATVDSFERGQAGEPLFVAATMQGCENAEGFDGCFFYSDGWRYSVSRDSGSNPAAFALLEQMPPNTPFAAVGDLISYGDVTAEVKLSRIEAIEPDAYAACRAAIQGDWVSIDDRSATLKITGSEELQLYAGEPSGMSILNFTDFCEDSAAPGGPFLTAREMQSADGFTLCYAIETLTPDRMVLMYLPRGNFLEYVRP